jgi:uncharacterized circularly permuted ATP-grasp superfamily protein/uncharacterized alpha-E superfamily protein
MEDPISFYDEMVTGHGAFRQHWRNMMPALRGLSPQQVAERQSRVAAQIADPDAIIGRSGPQPARRSRTLDLLPLILPAAEWRDIERGMTQRARLLDAIIADIYGEQRLIAERRLPPALIFGNPAFLRPLRGITPVGGAPYLYFYGVDLIRLPSGEWRVFCDRTQAAAGVGYALYQRNLLARIMPEAFRAVAVRRLQPFVDAWRGSLDAIGAALAPDGPQVVLLTPGPYNEAYFEHVLLARELGITLAQSADLTVRGDLVFLKTLKGLVRVDVIYRRVDGDYCDRLELREESELGVAGLIQVARKGRVAILNMPGTAVVGTPALTAFLPALSRHLLGEELRLPAVETWWCGQRHALDEVTAGLDRFALQRVFASDSEPIEPALLEARERAALAAEVAAHPARFVARERLMPSEAPCLAAETAQQGRLSLVARPVVLRAACIWRDGDWQALPGGVARVVADRSIYRSASHGSAITKDVWVLAEEEEADRAGPTFPSVRHVAEDAQLRSRSADDLFWLGRYVERLDTGARLFLAAFRRLASGSIGARAGAELSRLAKALNRTEWIVDTLAATSVGSVTFFDGMTEAALAGMTTRATVDSIERLTAATQDQLSPAMWQTLHHLSSTAIARFGSGAREPDALIEALEQTIATVAAFAGFAAENTLRGLGWHFLELGRRIERGVGSALAISGVMTGPVAQTEAGLRLALELSDVSGGPVSLQFDLDLRRTLHFVLAEPGNPRSLLYQIDRTARHLAAIGEYTGREVVWAPHAALSAELAAFPGDAAGAGGTDAVMGRMFRCLDQARDGIAALSDAVTGEFFSQVATSHFGRLRVPGASLERAS